MAFGVEKKIKLDQLQTVRSDEVGVACQWNGDLMDAQGGIDLWPECWGAYTSSKLCLSLDPHLCRGADVGTPDQSPTSASTKGGQRYHVLGINLEA